MADFAYAIVQHTHKNFAGSATHIPPITTPAHLSTADVDTSFRAERTILLSDTLGGERRERQSALCGGIFVSVREAPRLVPGFLAVDDEYPQIKRHRRFRLIGVIRTPRSIVLWSSLCVCALLPFGGVYAAVTATVARGSLHYWHTTRCAAELAGHERARKTQAVCVPVP